MKYYAICIRDEQDHFLKDHITGEDAAGFLVFRKKTDAAALADEMNDLRKGMKIEQVYSVCRFDSDDWKGHHLIVDHKEATDDSSRRNVPCYTKREELPGGSNGSSEDTKDSKKRKKRSAGKTQTLPL
jgi:hypothetical protein